MRVLGTGLLATLAASAATTLGAAIWRMVGTSGEAARQRYAKKVA